MSTGKNPLERKVDRLARDIRRKKRELFRLEMDFQRAHHELVLRDFRYDLTKALLDGAKAHLSKARPARRA